MKRCCCGSGRCWSSHNGRFSLVVRLGGRGGGGRGTITAARMGGGCCFGRKTFCRDMLFFFFFRFQLHDSGVSGNRVHGETVVVVMIVVVAPILRGWIFHHHRHVRILLLLLFLFIAGGIGAKHVGKGRRGGHGGFQRHGLLWLLFGAIILLSRQQEDGRRMHGFHQ